jgi:predicted RNA-binding protein with PUA-like domain
MHYWLFKKEPKNISIEDIEQKHVQNWHGVRNYQARNYIRGMEIGDLVLVYHSNSEPSGVAGIAKICSAPYDDLTAQDPTSYHPDSKATPENPIWSQIDVEFVEKFPRLVSLSEIREHPLLGDMLVIKRGMRLSIQPVTEAEFTAIKKLGNLS